MTRQLILSTSEVLTFSFLHCYVNDFFIVLHYLIKKGRKRSSESYQNSKTRIRGSTFSGAVPNYSNWILIGNTDLNISVHPGSGAKNKHHFGNVAEPPFFWGDSEIWNRIRFSEYGSGSLWPANMNPWWIRIQKHCKSLDTNNIGLLFQETFRIFGT